MDLFDKLIHHFIKSGITYKMLWDFYFNSKHKHLHNMLQDLYKRIKKMKKFQNIEWEKFLVVTLARWKEMKRDGLI